jgi:hypothetical protein
MVDHFEIAQQSLQALDAKIARQAALVRQFERYGQMVLATVGRTILMDLRHSHRAVRDHVELLKVEPLKKPPRCCQSDSTYYEGSATQGPHGESFDGPPQPRHGADF